MGSLNPGSPRMWYNGFLWNKKDLKNLKKKKIEFWSYPTILFHTKPLLFANLRPELWQTAHGPLGQLCIHMSMHLLLLESCPLPLFFHWWICIHLSSSSLTWLQGWPHCSPAKAESVPSSSYFRGLSFINHSLLEYSYDTKLWWGWVSLHTGSCLRRAFICLYLC